MDQPHKKVIVQVLHAYGRPQAGNASRHCQPCFGAASLGRLHLSERLGHIEKQATESSKACHAANMQQHSWVPRSERILLDA